MAGAFEKWDREKISKEGWTRYAIRPNNRASCREQVALMRAWFAEHGKGRCMIHVMDYSSYATIAFSDKTDCVLFRLTFTDIPIGLVRQPLCSERFRIP